MKPILFLFLFLPSVSFALKGNYRYNAVSKIENGSDNFRPSHFAAIEKEGSIAISHSSIRIDDKLLTLKPTNDRKIYKTRGGIVKFVYEDSELVSVQIFQYNSVYHFNIVSEDEFASN